MLVNSTPGKNSFSYESNKREVKQYVVRIFFFQIQFEHVVMLMVTPLCCNVVAARILPWATRHMKHNTLSGTILHQLILGSVADCSAKKSILPLRVLTIKYPYGASKHCHRSGPSPKWHETVSLLKFCNSVDNPADIRHDFQFQKLTHSICYSASFVGFQLIEWQIFWF